MSYSFIHDESQIKKFSTMFHGPDTVHLVYMAARKKYCTTITKGNECFNRVVIRYNDKNDGKLLNDIRRYETPYGTYTNGKQNTPIPQLAFAIYCSVNERDSMTAGKTLVKDLVDQAFEKNTRAFRNIDQQFKSNLQKYANKTFITIDIDTKDPTECLGIFNDIVEHVDVHTVIETRGGYHVILDKKKFNKKAGMFLYKTLPSKYEHVDKVDGDVFSPVPGTVQGGFQVKFNDVKSILLEIEKNNKCNNEIIET